MLTWSASPLSRAYSHKNVGRRVHSYYKRQNVWWSCSRHHFLGYKWNWTVKSRTNVTFLLHLVVISLRRPNHLCIKEMVKNSLYLKKPNLFNVLLALHGLYFMALILPQGVDRRMPIGFGGTMGCMLQAWCFLCNRIWATAFWDEAHVILGTAGESKCNPSQFLPCHGKVGGRMEKKCSLITTHVCALAERTQCNCGPEFCH